MTTREIVKTYKQDITPPYCTGILMHVLYRNVPDRNLTSNCESLLPAVKCEIQIHENLFPQNTKNQQLHCK